MNKALLSLLALCVLLFSACEDDESESVGTLTLSLSGLGDLGDDYVYEGWIVVDGSPVTTGTFNVSSDGTLDQTSFEVDANELAAATAFVLSIEPAMDSDPAPSETKLLGGDFSGNSASVSIDHGAALGHSFTAAEGSYFLKTPTTASTDEDDLSGVWFLNPSTNMASLDLPDLDGLSGWEYEGWAVIDGVPVSTGRFNVSTGSDDSGIYSGSDAGPGFPGEDFITNAPSGLTFPTDLTSGGVIVISIEPEPDNSSAPFELKPLVGMVPSDLTAGTLESMDNNATATSASGTVTR